MRRRRFAEIALGIAVGLAPAASSPLGAQEPAPADTAAADTPPSVVRGPEVLVEVQRLPSIGAPAGPVPFAAQTIRGDEVAERSSRSVTDLIETLPGVSTPDQFGSPYQEELRIRGFTVSPVVGLAQSVSVFVDGVRVNEPDASQVNFNLIPSFALEDASLVRGPLGPFGKNTLAGALILQTKRGRPQPFARFDVSGGYFSATEGVEEGNFQGEVGGQVGRVDLYGAGQYLRSDGWRQLNAAEQIHLFGKIGYRHEGTDAWISYTFVEDSIEAPGSLPHSWLEGGPLPEELDDFDGDRRQLQFTGGIGDFFVPTLHFVNGLLDQRLTDDWQLTLNAFGRFADFSQFNDNITEPNSLGETEISSYGSTAQLGWRPSPSLGFTGGFEYARHDVDIEIFQVPGGDFPDIEEELTENVGTEEDDVGGFLTASWLAGPRTTLHGSLRYDWIRIPFRDELDPEGSGTNIFRQLTGSTGVIHEASEGVQLFAGYGRGFRPPFILEITCADEDDPCPLPFELGADPPIDPVKNDTWQAGVRLTPGSRFQGELAAYWAEVYDEILFVTDPEGIRGFFTNVDKTRRQGLEALGRLEVAPGLWLSGTLGLTRATFQSTARLATGFVDLDDDDEEEGEEEEEEEEEGVEEEEEAELVGVPRPAGPEDDGDGDEDGDDDEVEAELVQPGDHFSIVPDVTFRVALDYDRDDWTLGVESNFVGSQFLVSDEANTEAFGKLDSYFLVNAAVARRFGPAELYLRAENLFDVEYEPFGLIARNARGPAVGEIDAFLTPGEPFRLFGGVRLRLQ